LRLLVHVVWGSIQRQQQLGASRPRKLCGPGLPDVGTDIHADAQALEFEHARRCTRLEVALLVEHFVVGQQVLVVACQDPAAAQDRRSIEARMTGLGRMAEDDPHVARSVRNPLRLSGAGAVEIRPQQEVFRRIAGQGEFRRKEQVGPCRAGLLDGTDDPIGVADEISDGQIELGDGKRKGHVSVRIHGAKLYRFGASAVHPRIGVTHSRRVETCG
jgi:hypothetical protein